MSVYDQIDAIFSREADDKPQWANEILKELKEIKTLLKEQKQTYVDDEYYDFIKRFRREMRASIDDNLYPTFDYKGRRLGIDFKGLLYDKSTSRIIPKKEAFEIYRFAYEQQKQA